MSVTDFPQPTDNLSHYQERVDLAAAFRWTARLNMHEAVANHFSLAVNEDGSKFLMNPNQVHFSRIKASDLLLIDADDPTTMDRPDAPDPTAWGLHGALHRICPHVKCAMHVHSVYATVLACLEDPVLPPIDQTSCSFYNRIAVDPDYGGLALEDEAERCCAHLCDPQTMILVMANHGIMVVGDTVAECFNRMYYFERAAETYVKSLWTQRPLRILSHEIAQKTCDELNSYEGSGEPHLRELKAILDEEKSDYAA
ncbi:MAG: class II aldolase and adducin N-terminal domain-containing protein [Pseudomonadota bacterium]